MSVTLFLGQGNARHIYLERDCGGRRWQIKTLLADMQEVMWNQHDKSVRYEKGTCRIAYDLPRTWSVRKEDNAWSGNFFDSLVDRAYKVACRALLMGTIKKYSYQSEACSFELASVADLQETVQFLKTAL